MGYAFWGVVEYAVDREGIKNHRVGEYDVRYRTHPGASEFLLSFFVFCLQFSLLTFFLSDTNFFGF